MQLEIVRAHPSKKTTKPPIVFVHGMWHGAWCWESNFMRRFVDAGYPCIALSMPGHGSSPAPERINSLGMKVYIEALADVIRSLDEAPILIGHSMGGRIIQEYLRETACAAAVLICPVPVSGLLRISLKMIFTTKYVFPSLLRLNLSGIVDSEEKIRSLFFTADTAPETVTECRRKLGNESMLAFIGMLSPLMRKGRLRETPMLVLSGGKDALFTKKECDASAQFCGAEHVRFEDLPHDLMLDGGYATAADRALEWLSARAARVES